MQRAHGASSACAIWTIAFMNERLSLAPVLTFSVPLSGGSNKLVTQTGTPGCVGIAPA